MSTSPATTATVPPEIAERMHREAELAATIASLDAPGILALVYYVSAESAGEVSITMPFRFIVHADPIRLGATASKRVRAILIAVIAIVIATAHRGAAGVWPHHVWFRQFEKYHIGMWAPSSIEHLVGGFGLVALVTLIFSCFVAPVTRNRFATGAAFGGCYFVGSTIGWTHLHYVATHDPAKLGEMAADVIGIIGAVLWVSWPQAMNNTRFALQKP